MGWGENAKFFNVKKDKTPFKKDDIDFFIKLFAKIICNTKYFCNFEI